MEEEITIYNIVLTFKNESQFDDFVKSFHCKGKMFDFLSWERKQKKRLLEANRRGESLIGVRPQVDSFVNWVKDNPLATEKEKMAKLIMSII